MDTTTGYASDLRQELGQDAAHLKDTLTDRAKQEAETGKNKALGIAGSATSALGVAADELRSNPDAPEWMATGLQKVARQIEQVATNLDGRSLEDMSRDLSRLVRDYPATFLAISAATGFFAARLLRAGADKQRHEQSENNFSQRAETRSVPYTDNYASAWPADENVKPTNNRGTDFEPVHDAERETVR